MILFLNFTPFTFGGGVERWMVHTASAVHTQEPAYLVDVHERISSIYGRLILKSTFKKRLTIETTSSVQKHLSLSLLSFIPFTSSWQQARTAFYNARFIYLRYELLEIMIVLSLGGIRAFKRTIAGIHSPFVYKNPITFFDHLHNLIYGSSMSRWALSRMAKVHVINPIDYTLFTKNFDLKNVVYVPNFIEIQQSLRNKTKKRSKNTLSIAFVGELNLRKGVDILIAVIKKCPRDYIFHIAGDGPMRGEIKKIKSLRNVTYHGYLNKQDIAALYADCDMLLVPSRAESFSLACLEAMSYGLPIFSSANTSIGLPSFMQQINKTGTTKEYLKMFADILGKKKTGKLARQKKAIQKYTKEHFSRDNVLPKLFYEILEIKK